MASVANQRCCRHAEQTSLPGYCFRQKTESSTGGILWENGGVGLEVAVAVPSLVHEKQSAGSRVDGGLQRTPHAREGDNGLPGRQRWQPGPETLVDPADGLAKARYHVGVADLVDHPIVNESQHLIGQVLWQL